MFNIFSIKFGLRIIVKIIVEDSAANEIRTGSKIFQLTPETTIIPRIMAIKTSVVPRSFCNKIHAAGINDHNAILKRSLVSFAMVRSTIYLLCSEIVHARINIRIIFINSDGCTLIGPSLYQLCAPLTIGVKGVLGKIINKIKLNVPNK